MFAVENTSDLIFIIQITYLTYFAIFGESQNKFQTMKVNKVIFNNAYKYIVSNNFIYCQTLLNWGFSVNEVKLPFNQYQFKSGLELE